MSDAASQLVEAEAAEENAAAQRHAQQVRAGPRHYLQVRCGASLDRTDTDGESL